MVAGLIAGVLGAAESDHALAILFFALTGAYALHLLVTLFRRVGKAPYCRKCGYNLTGAVSGRCPECGQSYESFGYDVGRRKFVLWRLYVGLGLLAYSAVMMVLLLSEWRPFPP